MEYNKVIKSVSSNQHEIIYNIMQLHNEGRPFDCDMTYSKGNFYGEHKVILDGKEETIEIPQPKYKFDVCPQADDVAKIEPFGALLLEDESIDSIMIDLPFVIGIGPSLKKIKDGSNVIHKRFGWYKNMDELYANYAHWIKEAYRVLKPNGICCFKTQATISSGINHDVPTFSKMMAMRCGFVNDDEFVLIAKSRLISGKVKTQLHARKFHSSFLIFKKIDSKKFAKFDYNKLIEEIDKE